MCTEVIFIIEDSCCKGDLNTDLRQWWSSREAKTHRTANFVGTKFLTSDVCNKRGRSVISLRILLSVTTTLQRVVRQFEAVAELPIVS